MDSTSMSWAAEVIADSTRNWIRNALRFATEAEAKGYVADLYARWTAVRETRVQPTTDPVNRSWDLIEAKCRDPLPRASEDLMVTPITDVAQFVRDIVGDAMALRHGRQAEVKPMHPDDVVQAYNDGCLTYREAIDRLVETGGLTPIEAAACIGRGP